ncbi:MAG: PTS system mannose/fructose/sorbose family transporter subunit IID [Gemmatimonadetes bacterium]|nr:PTS system mannose/fructose/sorbose family transporter subunit IID [Gemmatimonadota bacterium]
MNSALRSTLRLLVVQASWTYERLQGVGVAFASLPLLEELEQDPERHRAAVGRATEYFNAHPYLAGVAVGASAKAELTGVPGATVQRLKTALAGPLGALGDQLFWIGAVPLVMAVIVGAVSLGGGAPSVAVGVGCYFVIRCAVTVWGLRLGLRSGLGVARALTDSGLQQITHRVGLVAGFAVATAIPLAARWDPMGLGRGGTVALLLGVGAGAVAALVRQRVPSSRWVTLVAVGGYLLWHWSTG